MEPLVLTTMPVYYAKRAYTATSSLYRSLPRSVGPIVVEITTAEGKTSSKETITPSTPFNLPIPKLPAFLQTLLYHLHTIQLFVYSDVKTVLIPWTLFGLAHAYSIPAFNLNLKFSPTTLDIVLRTCKTMVWIYLNLLCAAIPNQIQPQAIVEDTINKAWRPLPSNRLTRQSASNLLLAARITTVIFSLLNGATSQSLYLFALSYAYNDLDLASRSVTARHALCALAFVAFGSGAMDLLIATPFAYSQTLTTWLRLIALVVATGVHTADMYDQEGDAVLKRRTLPLIIGDYPARCCVAVGVAIWSVVCPWYWGLSLAGYALPILGGAVVAKRALEKRTVEADRKTYKLWNLWLVVVYCLPLVKGLLA